jgi:hypothetical protein
MMKIATKNITIDWKRIADAEAIIEAKLRADSRAATLKIRKARKRRLSIKSDDVDPVRQVIAIQEKLPTTNRLVFCVNSTISAINGARDGADGGVTLAYVRSRPTTNGDNRADSALSEVVRLLSAVVSSVKREGIGRALVARAVCTTTYFINAEVNPKIGSINMFPGTLKVRGGGYVVCALRAKASLYSSVYRSAMKPYFSAKIGSKITSLRYCLTLNFRRIRFFPFLKREGKTPVFFNSSLGMLSNFFSKSKSFLRQKASYLLSASFLRKVMLYLGLKQLTLVIRGIPLYLQEILSTMLTPSKKTYDHPLRSPQQVVDENTRPHRFGFEYVIFTSLKPHSIMKRKKKGRLKRKIAKKIVLLNNILD